MPEQVTISGHPFTVDSPYAEGHECNANEAAALNQTRHENLRNNFASKVKAMLDGAGAISAQALASLQTEFDAYASAYAFGVRSAGGGGTRDPVLTEALSIARNKIKSALKAAGRNLKDVDSKAVTAAAHKLLDGPNGEAIKEAARQRVAEQRSIAAEGLAEIVAGIETKAA